MSSSKKKKTAAGRPALRASERAQRRVATRLHADEEQLLRDLCAALGASEAEVVRRALRALAEAEGVRAT
jgi:hypothetical protein